MCSRAYQNGWHAEWRITKSKAQDLTLQNGVRVQRLAFALQNLHMRVLNLTTRAMRGVGVHSEEGVWEKPSCISWSQGPCGSPFQLDNWSGANQLGVTFGLDL